ncbi:hypothetical protein NPIL_38171 [Nephila pilipes]|uniref:Uncharacterized protein n=1 Tax=Nephila pilipes TaxID=299642 RepID=A0A8X6UG26_NEPPI|nr:hypothetical protein NPIL_38171 [Nephila pilipes]
MVASVGLEFAPVSEQADIYWFGEILKEKGDEIWVVITGKVWFSPDCGVFKVFDDGEVHCRGNAVIAIRDSFDRKCHEELDVGVVWLTGMIGVAAA